MAKVIWIFCVVVGQIHAQFQCNWFTLTTVTQTGVRVTQGATTAGVKAGTVAALWVSFLTWSLAVTAVLLVTSILTVFISIALESAWDALSVSAFHQTLTVTRAVGLIRLVHTVVVTVAHPLGRDAAPVPTAVLLGGIAVAVLLIAEISTVVISITHKAVIQALARVTAEQIRAAVAMSFVAPVIAVVVAITLQFSGDTDSTGAQKVITPSAEQLLSIFLLR